jgi:hydrogenase maturation protease
MHFVCNPFTEAGNRTMLTRIIGIGSPFGDDAVGLEVARILSLAPPPNCEVTVADRPGVGLVELLDGVSSTILIDGVRSGAPPGTLRELSFEDLEGFAAHFVSSHDFGLAAAIQLARKLGRAPAQGMVLGVEIAAVPAHIPGPLSLTAQQAVSVAVAKVRCWVLETRGFSGKDA